MKCDDVQITGHCHHGCQVIMGLKNIQDDMFSYLVTHFLFHIRSSERQIGRKWNKKGFNNWAIDLKWCKSQKYVKNAEILSVMNKQRGKKESGSNFAQKGLAGRVLLRLLLWALLLLRMVQAGDGGLLGHRRGERLVSTCCVAADSAAGVWVIAPRWVGPSLSPHLSGEKSRWHILVYVKPLLCEEDLLLRPALSN